MTDNETYAGFIRELVERQDRRKDSLEARGITVITTSGGLATLLFAFAAFVSEPDRLPLSSGERSLLSLAVVAFVAAAVLALLTNRPMNYGEPGPSTPHDLLVAWDHDPERSRKEVSKAWGKVFAQAKLRNEQKAQMLVLAMAAEVAGIAFVAATVWRIL